MKTKLILTRFGLTLGSLRFKEKSFFLILYQNTHLIGIINQPMRFILITYVYTSDKVLNSIKIDKIHLKCDVIDGSVVNGTREPILFSFVLEKPSGYKVFCEPETIHYRKIINLF